MNPYGVSGRTVPSPAAFSVWNDANERARDEYGAHPFAICLGIRRTDGEETPCFGVRERGDLCRHCASERAYAAARMREKRAKR